MVIYLEESDKKIIDFFMHIKLEMFIRIKSDI